MTVKQVAEFFGKSENTIRRAASRCGVDSKNGVALVFSKSDLWLVSRELWENVPEAVKIAIEETFPNGNPNGKVTQRKSRLPSGAQMSVMLKTYGPKEAGKRFDFCIGYSSRVIEKKEQIEVAPREQGLLEFEEIKARFASNKN